MCTICRISSLSTSNLDKSVDPNQSWFLSKTRDTWNFVLCSIVYMAGWDFRITNDLCMKHPKRLQSGLKWSQLYLGAFWKCRQSSVTLKEIASHANPRKSNKKTLQVTAPLKRVGWTPKESMFMTKFAYFCLQNVLFSFSLEMFFKILCLFLLLFFAIRRHFLSDTVNQDCV